MKKNKKNKKTKKKHKIMEEKSAKKVQSKSPYKGTSPSILYETYLEKSYLGGWYSIGPP